MMRNLGGFINMAKTGGKSIIAKAVKVWSAAKRAKKSKAQC